MLSGSPFLPQVANQTIFSKTVPFLREILEPAVKVIPAILFSQVTEKSEGNISSFLFTLIQKE